MLMSAWRLSRAPFQAKLMKFADIIDNCASIRAHDPNFFKVVASEKKLILTRMLEIEGSGLADHVCSSRHGTPLPADYPGPAK